MRAAQPPRADQIHRESDHGDDNGFGVVNGLRPQQAFHRLPDHERRDAQQEQRAGVAAEHLDLPGAECVAAIARVPARERIRECRETERQRVRAHVPAVREHRHGVEPPAAGDLDDHHDGREPHRAPHIAFGERIAGVEARGVAVVIVHARKPIDRAPGEKVGEPDLVYCARPARASTRGALTGDAVLGAGTLLLR